MVTSYSRYGIYCFLAGLMATANAAENKPFGLRSVLENKNSPMNFTKQHRNLLFTATQIGFDIDGLPHANAGHAVALQCAGANPMRVGVGSPHYNYDNGIVRTFDWNGSSWIQVGGDVTEVSETTGFSISLSLDGSRMAVGSVYDWVTKLGETRVYQMVGGVWTQMGVALAGGPWGLFGKSIRLSDDGNRLVVGSPRGLDPNNQRTGVVKVFEFDGTDYVQLGADVVGSENGDIFGDAVSISGDGSTIVVGAKFGSNDSGHVRVYKWNGTMWALIGDIDGVAADDCYGFSVDIDYDGNCIAASSIGSEDDPADLGYVNAFKYDGTNWMAMGSTLYEEGNGDQFGFSVSLSDNCGRLAVGASRNDGLDSNGNPVINNGHVRVYDWDGSLWVQSYSDIDGEAAGDKSGASVSLGNNGMCLAIGAPVNNGGNGHTRIYDLPFAPGTTTSGGGGDPHFKRWNQENRNTFHGECDLVVVHSESFHNVGFDMHVRTTIQDFFSYIEAAAVKLGEDILEVENGNLKLNGVDHSDAELPLVFGEQKYTLYKYSEENRNDGSVFRRTYRLTLEDDTEVEFRFFKKFMTYQIIGHPGFADSVGLMGQYPTGAMLSRAGAEMQDFVQFGFEWQVSMEDPVLFADARSPQLPYEQCRMPTAAQSAIRRLKSGNRKLMEAAQEACAGTGSKLSDHNIQLCVDDVMMTGDLEMAGEW